MTAKKVNVNCGNAIIFNPSLGALSGFEGGTINAGDVIASTKAYQKLIEKGFSINAGSISTVDIQGTPLLLENGDCLLAGDGKNFKGRYLVIKEDLVLPAYKKIELDEIEGLYVGGTLYYPDDFTLCAIPGLRADAMKSYPKDSIVTHEKKVELNKERFLLLDEGKTHYYTGVVTIKDWDLKEVENSNREVSIIAKELIIREEFLSLVKLQANQKKVVIPGGHEMVENETLSATTFPLYGDKLYVSKNFLVQPKAVSFLKNFTSIVVGKKAELTLEALQPFKAIGKAKKTVAFEGEKKEANGKVTYCHEGLEALKNTGVTYSFTINGVAQFDNDVLPEDIDVFASIYCNGVIMASPAIQGALHQKIVELNGTMIDNNNTFAENLKNIGIGDAQDKGGKESEENASTINIGELIIV